MRNVVALLVVAAALPAATVEDRFRKAEELFRRAEYRNSEGEWRALFPDSADAKPRYFVGLICVMTGRSQEGRRLLEDTVKRDPGFGKAWKALGLLDQQQSHHREAEAALRKAAELLPSDARAQLLLGRTLTVLGKYEEAESVLKQARSLSPVTSRVGRETRVELGLLAVAKAVSLFDNQRREEAILVLEKAERLLPPSAGLRALLGRAYWRLEDPRALAHLLRAAELQAGDPPWDLYAQAMADFGKFDEAVIEFSSRVEKKPDRVSFRLLLGAALWDMTDYKAALLQYEKAAALDPGSVRAHFLAGSAYRLLGRTEQAEAALRQSLSLDGDFEPALSALGEILAAEGDWKEAAEIFESIRKIKPRDIETRLQLGRIYRGIGRIEEAARELESAVQLGPDDKRAYYLLGGVYGQLNRPVKAEEAFGRFAGLEAEELKKKRRARPYLSTKSERTPALREAPSASREASK